MTIERTNQMDGPLSNGQVTSRQICPRQRAEVSKLSALSRLSARKALSIVTRIMDRVKTPTNSTVDVTATRPA